MNVVKAGRALGNLIHEIANRESKDRGFSWIASVKAPETLVEMQTEARLAMRTGIFSVSCRNNDNTIYGDEGANMAFRFWHDMLHLDMNLGTSLVDEIKVGEAHVAYLQSIGVRRDMLTLMWLDTVGQTLYNYVAGRFPTDQMQFAVLVDRGLAMGFSLEQSVRHIALHHGDL